MTSIFVPLDALDGFSVAALFPVRKDSAVLSDDVAGVNRHIEEVLYSQFKDISHFKPEEFRPWGGRDWLFGHADPQAVANIARSWNETLRSRAAVALGEAAARTDPGHDAYMGAAHAAMDAADEPHARSGMLVLAPSGYEFTCRMPDYMAADAAARPEKYAVLKCGEKEE